MSRRLRLALHQLAPTLRNPSQNAERIADAARAADADLMLTPELSLTGYDVGDDVHRLATPLEHGAAVPFPALRDLPPVVVGAIERGVDAVPRNAAMAVVDGRIEFIHRKIYLPTYGMFDEMRFFGRGDRIQTWQLGDWRIGLLVCEDFWHPGLIYLLAAHGVHLLLVSAAAPGRGAWDGGSAARFASTDVWARIAASTASAYGIYVGLCNRVGVEGGVTFGGGSLIVAPDASVLARAGDEEATIEASLDLGELGRARQPFAHARDEDLRFMRAELDRLIEARR